MAARKVQEQEEAKEKLWSFEAKSAISTSRSSSPNQFNNNAENEIYDLCFVVENCEFLSLKQGFVAHSQYLRELL